MSEKDVLPKWAECSKKVDDGGRLNPIERLIYDNEAFGQMGVEFRRELHKALKYYKKYGGKYE